jgi:hypothetical protein
VTEQVNSNRQDLVNADLLFPCPRHHLIEYAINTRDARLTTIGTPEHCALIQAIKENFPEVYGQGQSRPPDGSQPCDPTPGRM